MHITNNVFCLYSHTGMLGILIVLCMAAAINGCRVQLAWPELGVHFVMYLNNVIMYLVHINWINVISHSMPKLPFKWPQNNPRTIRYYQVMEQLQDNLEEHDRLQEQIGGSALLWFCPMVLTCVFLTMHGSWLWPLTSRFAHSAVPTCSQVSPGTTQVWHMMTWLWWTYLSSLHCKVVIAGMNEDVKGAIIIIIS